MVSGFDDHQREREPITHTNNDTRIERVKSGERVRDHQSEINHPSD